MFILQYMKIRRQLGVGSLFPQYRSQESNSGPPVWWQAPFTPPPPTVLTAPELFLREAMLCANRFPNCSWKHFQLNLNHTSG